jgi:cytoskeletal protein CcmA (bactofilin family)
MARPSFFSENLNGFIDQGTEFVGELRFPRYVPHRRNGARSHRLRQHAGDRRTRIRGGGDRLRVVSIRGRVRGHVHARDRIEILAGARVEATLDSPRLVVEEGASLAGQTDVGARDL